MKQKLEWVGANLKIAQEAFKAAQLDAWTRQVEALRFLYFLCHNRRIGAAKR